MARLPKNFVESKNPVQIYADRETRRAMVAFAQAQRITPSMSDVGELALQEFLKSEGYYPPPAEAEPAPKKGKGKQ